MIGYKLLTFRRAKRGVIDETSKSFTSNNNTNLWREIATERSVGKY